MFILKNEVTMSGVLLNTVGAGNNKGYMMTFPVNNLPSAVKSEPVSVQEKDKSSDNNMLTAGLVGLGILGAAFATVKGVKVYNNKKLTKEIFDLKNILRNKYLLAKNGVIEDFNKQKFPESFYINGSSEFRINSSKDLKPLCEYYVSECDKFSQLEKDNMHYIKSTLAKLSLDDEWKNLRHNRKILLKDIGGNNEVQRRIAYKKIALVNDLLSYKVHPETEKVFEARNLITVDDARYLVNKDFADLHDYETELAKRIKFGFEYSEMEDFFVNDGRLFIANLFPKEIQTIETARNKAKLIKVIIDDDIKPLQESFIAKLHELAYKFRSNEDVLKFKKLIFVSRRS